MPSNLLLALHFQVAWSEVRRSAIYTSNKSVCGEWHGGARCGLSVSGRTTPSMKR